MGSSYRSFTLLELLVVIAIIATLISLGTLGINYVQARSRDMQRLEDMRNMQIALDAYF